jgi:nitrilase
VDVPSQFTEVLGQAAKRAGLHIVIGVNERVPSGTLYNSLVFIGPDGSLLGKRRKLVPTFFERMVWGRGDGSTIQVFDTELGCLGGLICWEHWMPLTRYALYAQGMQVCASAWPSVSGGNSLEASQHLAFEGRCFVVKAGAYLTKDHLPSDFELAKEIEPAPEIIYSGDSTIIGPDGKCLNEPVSNKETIVYAEIDLERVYEEKQTLDVVGHYSRPDVFRFTVNCEPGFSCRTVGNVGDMDMELYELEKLATKASPEVVQEKIRILRERIRS